MLPSEFVTPAAPRSAPTPEPSTRPPRRARPTSRAVRGRGAAATTVRSVLTALAWVLLGLEVGLKDTLTGHTLSDRDHPVHRGQRPEFLPAGDVGDIGLHAIILPDRHPRSGHSRE